MADCCGLDEDDSTSDEEEQQTWLTAVDWIRSDEERWMRMEIRMSGAELVKFVSGSKDQFLCRHPVLSQRESFLRLAGL